VSRRISAARFSPRLAGRSRKASFSAPRPVSAGAWLDSEEGGMINNGERSYASLSSGLLARKGAAKPAMRPQGYGQSHGFDDLGWNDMGQVLPPVEELEDDLPEHVPSSISALTPAPKSPRNDEPVEEPDVVAQQRAIAESFPPEADAGEIEVA